MSGDLRVSMLLQANAGQAKAEVAGMRAEVEALAKGVVSAGREAQAASPQIGAIGDAAGGTASDLILAAQAGAEWDAAVQLVRASIQPMVGEMAALQASAQQLAVYEEMGALSANEAARAHDALARRAIDLAGRMEAAGVTIDGTTVSIKRQDTSLQELINRQAGVSTATEETIADTLRHGYALDELRARYNPLFAASRQYELELRNIAEAERLEAISAIEAAAARERASTALAPIPDQLGRMGVSSQAAASHLGQLGFQLNDIVMMMSLGQSPFMLMMQQGPQVTQVFDGMRRSGMAIGPAIAGAFTSMLNPVSLVTMAVIGFGTAAVQWFTSTQEEVQDAEDALRDFADIESKIDKANDVLAMSLEELIAKYGRYAFAARDAAKALREHSAEQAKSRLKEGIVEASEELDRYAAKMSATMALDPKQSGARGQAAILISETRAALQNLQDDMGVSQTVAIRLADAFGAVQRAASFDDRLAAIASLRAELERAGIAAGELPSPLQAVLAAAADANLEMASLAGSIDEGASAMARLLSSAPGGGWLSGAIADAAALAAELWNAATASSSIDSVSGAVGAVGGSVVQSVIGWFSGSDSAPETSDRPRRAPPMLDEKTGSSGAASGGAAAKEEATALQRLFDEERRQIEALQALDPLQAEILKNHEALKDATEDERGAVSDLIAERMRLEEVRDRLEEIERTGKSAFTGLVTGALSFSDAISNVLMSLAEMAASDAWDLLWGGSAGSGGGLGGFVEGLLGLGPKAATSADLSETVGRKIGKTAPAAWGDATSGRKASSAASGGATQGAEVAVRIYFDSRKADWTAEVERVAGNVATDRVMEGITLFSSHVLPGRMAEIDENPRVVG